MAYYQSAFDSGSPLYVGNCEVFYVDGSGNKTSLGPLYGVEISPDVKTQTMEADNASMPDVIGEETASIKFSVPQFMSDAFISIWGGVLKKTVDGSGNMTGFGFGGNAQEISAVSLRFVHKKAGDAGGMFVDVWKAYFKASGAISFPKDSEVTTPLKIPVELTAKIDSTKTENQIFVAKKFSGAYSASLS